MFRAEPDTARRRTIHGPHHHHDDEAVTGPGDADDVRTHLNYINDGIVELCGELKD